MSAGDDLGTPPGLRARHRKSSVFAGVAAGSLALGLLVVVVLVFTTVREAGKLSYMHATAATGLALSQRAGAVGEKSAYVTVAKVETGSAAEKQGLAIGDALLAIDGRVVREVHEVWSTIAALPASDAPRRITRVANVEALLGELEAAPVPGQNGVFRARLAGVGSDTTAARAGLRDGDVLVAANGTPLHGTHQTWQSLVLAARASKEPVQLAIERDGVPLTVSFAVRQECALPLVPSLGPALWHFVTSLDEPRYPEFAGIASAILGSLLVVFVTIVFAFPLGIATAVYLEEYAKRGRLTSLLQVLIANLAGIPSVVYGIIGLEIIDRTIGLGRSVLAGGLTLGLLILPVMILGCREALRTVPPWVRHAAFAIGATPSQVVWHQVLPYALPGMLTAMILAISRAIGEAAPLIMLAYLFVTDLPRGLTDTFTVVPLQIFEWATRPQSGYDTIAAVAILVLLAILLLLNGTAIVLRNRFQLRW
jgi:phosphate transport system permease protein